MTEQSTILTVIILYLLLMIGIGAYYYNKNRNAQDYILGGRKLNVWTSALSAQASDMSGWLLMGLPGLAYLSLAGSLEAWWTAIGLAVGTLLNWMFVAKRLRGYTEVSGNALTLPDYFENRFKDKSKAIRTATGIAIVVFFIVYTSSMFAAGAKLFMQIFTVEYTTALIISSLIIIAYTFLGGFLAVCFTDVMQGVLMFIAIIVVPVVVISRLGGGAATLAMLEEGAWNFFPSGDGTVTWLLIISSLAWGLGYCGQPHILARFMAIKSPKEVKPATLIAMIWVVISLACAVLVGMFGKAYLTSTGGLLASGAEETIFIALIYEFFPAIIAGILISAVLAAIMSTADSQLLVTSSVIASDFYRGLIKKDATDKEVVWVSRLSVVGVALLAVALALDPNSSVFGIVSFAWAGLGAAFGPTVVMSIYWKRMTRKGAIWGICSGGLGSILFYLLKTSVGGIFAVYELLPAFIVSVIAIVIASLLDKEPTDDIVDEFDRTVEYANEK